MRHYKARRNPRERKNYENMQKGLVVKFLLSTIVLYFHVLFIQVLWVICTKEVTDVSLHGLGKAEWGIVLYETHSAV